MSLMDTNVGKIRISKKLGQGGMGEVYAAYDEKLKRHVAIKAIKGATRFKPEVKARFVREAEILSQLEHPNICRIYDLLEEDDCDYIVLELVKGENLETAQNQGLELAAKWKIAKQIVQALAAAHAKNIAHRDLKPENVMVTPEGDVKILDFGLARSFTEALAAGSKKKKTVLDARLKNDDEIVFESGFKTEDGIVTGTPMYMSPEQARGDAVTAASDMYSFGLLIHRLFSGNYPYPTDIGSMGLMYKVMKGETLPVEGLDSELEELIKRLTSPSPDIRPTAVETLDRLKWIQRKPVRRMQIASVIGFIIVLFFGTFFSTSGFLKAKQSEKRATESEKAAISAKNRAEQARDEAEAVNAFLQNMLTSADPWSEGNIDVKVVDVLDHATDHIDKDFENQPLIKAAIHHTLGNTFHSVGKFDAATDHFEQALNIRRRILEEDHPDTLNTMNFLGLPLWDQGKYADAEVLNRELLSRREKVLGIDHPDTLSTKNNLARVLSDQGKHEEGLVLQRTVVETRERILGKEHPDTITCTDNLALILSRLGNYSEAEKLHRSVLERSRHILGESHPDTLATLNYLLLVLAKQEKLSEAEVLSRDLVEKSTLVLGSDHPRTLRYQFQLGELLERQNHVDQALSIYRDAAKNGQADAQAALRRMATQK